jgi:hypothetical protein
MLEERVEDALVDWLTLNLSGDMHIHAAFDVDRAQYPQVSVFCESSEPVSADALPTGHRTVTCIVTLATLAEPETDDNNEPMTSAREYHAMLKGQLLTELHRNDAALILNTLPASGVQFSSLFPEGLQRSVEEHRLITAVTMRGIAHPTTVEA